MPSATPTEGSVSSALAHDVSVLEWTSIEWTAGPAEETRIRQPRPGYLRMPLLFPSANGGAELFMVLWGDHCERVVGIAFDDGGNVASALRALEVYPWITSLTRANPPQPSNDIWCEDHATVAGWGVHIERAQRVSCVRVQLPDGRTVDAWTACGIATAPAIAPTADGAWIAFHHDVREDDSKQDLAKWIALRFVTADGEVLELAQPMPDRDRDRQGVEQSFEFPSLVVGSDGAVALFGRGSHNVWRQDFGGSAAYPRTAMSDGEWGCRGRRIAAVKLGNGRVLTARRERDGIVLARLPEPSGGRPALRPAATKVESIGSPLEGGSRRPQKLNVFGHHTLFGDIHQHSAHSDGIGTAHEAYVRARDVYRHDFCALTDHESFLGKRTGPGEWAYLQQVADHYDEPDQFATLIAYEWTARMHPGPGHKCVYFARSSVPIVSRDDFPEGAQLIEQVRRFGGIAVPHHVGWTGADAESHDPEMQPVWEICSCHGCYECHPHPLGARGDLPDQFVDTMLKRGLRFGFIACSDSHGLLWHHGVARVRDPYRTGLTAVQAERCTREAIVDALRARRCYATSGAKILLDFRAGTVPMGGVARRSEKHEARAEVHGTSSVTRLELVTDAGVIAATSGPERHAVIETHVDAAYAYARVIQDDGEWAWSSPIFFE